MGFSYRDVLNALSASNAARVLIISKSTCPFCSQVESIFKRLDVPFRSVQIDQELNQSEMFKFQDEMQADLGARTVPQVFLDKKHIGDCSKVKSLLQSGELAKMIEGSTEKAFQYEYCVIGGGSGGVSSVKRASLLRPDKKFVIFDYVSPTPLGTSWDIGGCCVNVGCIPKKLFHKASLLGHSMKDSKFLQSTQNLKNNWEEARSMINGYICSLNFATKTDFMNAGNIEYINAKAKLTAPNEISYEDPEGKAQKVTAKHVLLATGTRPLLPDNLQPLKEYILTSDDLFWLAHEPKDTIVIGGGYVACECACFLAGLGYNVTLIAREICLRSFDRECTDIVVEGMRRAGVNVCLDTSISQIDLIRPVDRANNEPGLFRVKCKSTSKGTEVFDREFNTVFAATGRYAETGNIYNPEKVPIEKNPKNGKLFAKNEQTNIPNVYVLGDILSGGPELTPVAVAAGRKLANRLFDGEKSEDFLNYENVATTVFTHWEFATVGLSEESAVERYGREQISIYKTGSMVHEDSSDLVFGKVIALNDTGKVLGLHFIGSEVGELIQGFSLLMHKDLKIESVLSHNEFVWVEKPAANSANSPTKKNRKDVEKLDMGVYRVC